jgi:hypothetical protein
VGDIVPGLVCVHQSQDVDAVLQYKQARPLPTKIYEHGTALFFPNTTRNLLALVTARLFYFLAFFRKIFASRPFLERFQKMNPELDAVDHGAELTCLGATDHGAEVLGLKTISVTLL